GGGGRGARRSPARAALDRDRGHVAGRPDRLLLGRRRRSRARPPLPRLPPAPRRPPGAAPCRPPPGRGGPDAVRAGHARRALRAGAAPPRPRPATARHAPHHRGRRSLLPRPAPRGGGRGRRGPRGPLRAPAADGGTPRPTRRAWAEDRERRPRPLARGATTAATPGA